MDTEYDNRPLAQMSRTDRERREASDRDEDAYAAGWMSVGLPEIPLRFYENIPAT